MTRTFLAISLMAYNLSFAQPASISLEGKNNTLNERYHLMKSNSQTFQDYKVIKEFVLDGVWKIVMDSVKSQGLAIVQSHETISQLEANLKSVELTLKKERESAAEIVHDSTHMAMLGIDFKKNTFLMLLTFVFAGFAIIISFSIGNMSVMRARMKEKMVIADLVSNEYEEFKRKTLEKQTKLSRELQTERNRIEELMRA